MSPIQKSFTTDYTDATDQGTVVAPAYPCSSAPSAVKKSGWLRAWLDEFFPRIAGEIEVRIAPNARGGWAIFPANAAAVGLFAGNGECGNFGTYAAAYTRAVRDNCWTVLPAKEAA
ncbi:MAG: hypothetical protein HZA93_24100 [Verrucomicrobia bacterium]|nr:hypothetical protein [Verrucomicrobiota bacterium]